ncbi:MAG: glycosyltransferase family 4 protein [Planctomycetota bacterium]|jgi:glycosyltransferase involved in cell wall biosynthesis
MSMRILALGAWDEGSGYPRARALLAGLRGQAVELREERVTPVLEGDRRRGIASAPWRWPGWYLANRRLQADVLGRLRKSLEEQRPDAIVLPYPGHVLAPAVREVYSGPIVLDLFLSAFGTMVEDRKVFPRWSPPARMLRRIDAAACAAADLVLMDTSAHAEWVRAEFDLPMERVSWVPVSDPDEAALRPESLRITSQDPLRLLFFGTGVPLHGLDLLSEALVSTPEVDFTLIGGSEGERKRAFALLGDRLRLLPDFVEAEELRREISAAHLVAGVFGSSQKASLVLPFKVMHACSLARPVLSADTPGLRQFLRPGVDCFACPGGDSQAISRALRQIAREPARLPAMGEAARASYQEKFSLAATGRCLTNAISEVIEKGRPAESKTASLEALSQP